MFCDFIVWTERSIHIERIYPDEELWLPNLACVKHFFETAILPELMGKFYSRTVPEQSPTSTALSINSAQAKPLNERYCYCNGPEEGNMVGCDNSSCTYKWFHLHCLGLKSLPKSKHWYCPDCRKLNQFRVKRKRTN